MSSIKIGSRIKIGIGIIGIIAIIAIIAIIIIARPIAIQALAPEHPMLAEVAHGHAACHGGLHGLPSHAMQGAHFMSGEVGVS